MKFVAQLAGGSILMAIFLSVASRVAGLGSERDIWLGMLGPMLATVIAWTAIEHQRRRLNPQKVLKCLIRAFALKFLFFGAYIIVLVKTDQVSLKPFVVCFVFFYLALHMAEALKLRRMQTQMATNINRQ